MANYEIFLPENVEQTMNGVQLLTSLPSKSDDFLPNFDPLIFCLEIKGILDFAFHTVDNVLLGTPPRQGPETKVFESYSDNSSDLLCKLQQISSELAACKMAPGGGNELKTTISILNKLSSYTWAGKAVLVIAAFALDYGDFWGLAQLHSLEKLAESVGITRRVLAMSKRPDLKKCQKVIEIRKLIENTMEVITSIAELEVNYSKWAENFGNILSMTAIAKCNIPVHVFWAVVTVVASTTQMYCLSSDEEKTLELSPLSQKMNSAWNILKTQIEECDQQIEEVKAYREPRELPETPTKIVEAFKALFFADESSELLIDGSCKLLLRADALKNKNVLLFISDITDISVKEISILKPIFDGIKDRDEQYKIVWIPIAEHWTDDVQAKFEMLQFNMPWYILKRFPAIVDMQIVRNEYCSLKNKPIVVVINPKWEVEHPNALRMIRLWGMKAFPFTVLAEQALIPIGLHYQTRMPVLARDSGPTSRDDREHYIFHYGFGDIRLRQRFTTLLDEICHYIRSNGLNIGISWDSIDIEERWRSTGWVKLYKGTTTLGEIVVCDQGTKILEVLEKFETGWHGSVRNFGFDRCFMDCYNELQSRPPGN